MSFITKLFTGGNDREIKKMWPLVEEINAFEEDVRALTDDELRAQTDEFRQRFKDGETLDDLLPEAFAVVREAIFRQLGQRAFDVAVVARGVVNCIQHGAHPFEAR